MHLRRRSFPKRWRVSITLVALLAVSGDGTGQTRGARENSDHYKKWLQEDVFYIISPEEAEVFKKLTTPEEKDAFIEQFWVRRDTDPKTSINEFQEEHYRRIQYANEHFTSGRPGWRTDRGRFYIRFGPPDDIASYTGGAYARRPYEGGGTTSTYPFQRWRYRYIEGIGNEIELEFVDSTMSGDYRLALDADEKDALFNVVGMGNTLDETTGKMTRSDRVRYRYYANPNNRDLNQPGLFTYRRLQDEVFYRVDQLMRLEKPPAISNVRLKELVEARVMYGQKLPFECQYSYYRLGEDDYLVPISARVANRDLEYETGAAGIRFAKVNLVCRVAGMDGRIAAEFDDNLYSQYGSEEFPEKDRHFSLYQKILRLRPGRYKASLVLQTADARKTGSSEFAIQLPPKLQTTEMNLSPIVLSEYISRILGTPSQLSPFVIGDIRVVPSFGRKFAGRDEVGVYAQAYDFQVDASTGKPSLKVRFEVATDQGSVLREFDDDGGRSYQMYGANRLVISKKVPLLDLPAGRYELRVYVRDEIAGREKKAIERFTVGG